MLKLEKIGDLSNIAIRMREKEVFFEPNLLKALLIALIIHCGALLLFHVTPLSFSSTFTFPPVQVQSDLPLAEVSALISYPEEDYEIPPPLLSFVPSLDWMTSFAESSLAPSISIHVETLESLDALEKRVWPIWEEPLSIVQKEPRIQLAISGDLAEFPLIGSDPLLMEMQPLSFNNEAAYVDYKVQLNPRTGEIFWFDRLESTGTPEVHRLTEKILLNLRFALPEIQMPIVGTVNFVILNLENAVEDNKL